MSRILAQVAVAANVMTDAYVVPEERLGGVPVAAVRVINRSSGKLRATVAISCDGSADCTEQRWADNVDIPYGTPREIPINLTVPMPGVVRVKANGSATFVVLGD